MLVGAVALHPGDMGHCPETLWVFTSRMRDIWRAEAGSGAKCPPCTRQLPRATTPAAQNVSGAKTEKLP